MPLLELTLVRSESWQERNHGRNESGMVSQTWRATDRWAERLTAVFSHPPARRHSTCPDTEAPLYRNLFSRSELSTTEMLENAMAAAANMGLSRPVIASGIITTL